MRNDPNRVPNDAVTFARRELKFALPGTDAAKVSAILSSNLEAISFGTRRDSIVRSIYFDDDQLLSCRESMDGISRRTKVRLRWYDSPFGEQGRAWLELKHRHNVNISKERMPVELARPLNRYRYAELHKLLLHAASSETAREWLVRRNCPTVMVAYRRRHYRDPHSGVRVTVDRDIRGYDQLGFLSPGQRFATPLADLVVIEVKTPLGEEFRAAELLYPLKLRLTRSSKYASCCAIMGWGILSESHD